MMLFGQCVEKTACVGNVSSTHTFAYNIYERPHESSRKHCANVVVGVNSAVTL